MNFAPPALIIWEKRPTHWVTMIREWTWLHIKFVIPVNSDLTKERYSGI